MNKKKKLIGFRSNETVCLSVSNYLNGNLRLTLDYPDGSYCEEITVYTDEKLDMFTGYVRTFEIPEAINFIVSNKLGKRVKNNTLIINRCASLLYEFNQEALKSCDLLGYERALQTYEKKKEAIV